MPLDWKSELARLRPLPPEEAIGHIRGILSNASGRPARVKEARAKLFLLCLAALRGEPTLIEIDAQVVVVMSAVDLAEIICLPSIPTFDKGTRRPRRIVRNRQGD